jgi:peptidoglycan hydrolase-like protein with peptidoglycan-binding domain
MIRDTPGNRDKHYGDETVKVIKRFQAANGLIADGRIGPKTWPALLAFDH